MQPTLTKYAWVIIKKKQWKRQSAALIVRKQNVLRDVRYPLTFRHLYMQVKEGNFEEAYQIISESSALPAVCGRVCPQESTV